MSDGCVSTTKPAFAGRRVDFSGMFDWVADRLRLATPQNVIRVLNSVRDDSDYIEGVDDYLPRRYAAEFAAFKQLAPEERLARAKVWFSHIEPGFTRQLSEYGYRARP